MRRKTGVERPPGGAGLRPRHQADGAALSHAAPRAAAQLPRDRRPAEGRGGRWRESSTQLQEPSLRARERGADARARVGTASSSGPTRRSPARRPAIGRLHCRNVTTVDPDLGEQIAALERLSLLPTARLERVFAEHIDCCGYRLDAWKTGLLTQELERLSQTRSEQAPAGLFLGAFGWVESLRPDRGKVLTPVELPGDLAGPVNRRDQAPLLRDDGQWRADSRAVAQPRHHRGGAAQRLPRQRRSARGEPLVAPRAPRARHPGRHARRTVARRVARIPVRALPPRSRAAHGSRAGLSASTRFPARGRPDRVDPDPER